MSNVEGIGGASEGSGGAGQIDMAQLTELLQNDLLLQNYAEQLTQLGTAVSKAQDAYAKGEAHAADHPEIQALIDTINQKTRDIENLLLVISQQGIAQAGQLAQLSEQTAALNNVANNLGVTANALTLQDENPAISEILNLTTEQIAERYSYEQISQMVIDELKAFQDLVNTDPLAALPHAESLKRLLDARAATPNPFSDFPAEITGSTDTAIKDAHTAFYETQQQVANLLAAVDIDGYLRQLEANGISASVGTGIQNAILNERANTSALLLAQASNYSEASKLLIDRLMEFYQGNLDVQEAKVNEYLLSVNQRNEDLDTILNALNVIRNVTDEQFDYDAAYQAEVLSQVHLDLDTDMIDTIAEILTEGDSPIIPGYTEDQMKNFIIGEFYYRINNGLPFDYLENVAIGELYFHIPPENRSSWNRHRYNGNYKDRAPWGWLPGLSQREVLGMPIGDPRQDPDDGIIKPFSEAIKYQNLLTAFKATHGNPPSGSNPSATQALYKLKELLADGKYGFTLPANADSISELRNLSEKQVSELIESIQGAQSNLMNDSQSEMLELQNAMNKYQQAYEMMTNLLSVWTKMLQGFAKNIA